jgi:hypothetical protein
MEFQQKVSALLTEKGISNVIFNSNTDKSRYAEYLKEFDEGKIHMMIGIILKLRLMKSLIIGSGDGLDGQDTFHQPEDQRLNGLIIIRHTLPKEVRLQKQLMENRVPDMLILLLMLVLMEDLVDLPTVTCLVILNLTTVLSILTFM